MRSNLEMSSIWNCESYAEGFLHEYVLLSMATSAPPKRFSIGAPTSTRLLLLGEHLFCLLYIVAIFMSLKHQLPVYTSYKVSFG